MHTHRLNELLTLPDCNSRFRRESAPGSTAETHRFLPMEQRSIEL
jgi:hypothetical protein